MYKLYVDNAVNIAVYDLNPAGKETIVLVHGWPLSEKIFEYQKNLLICCDYRIITLDLRGFGNSDVPAFGYTYDDFATDLYCIIRKLKLTSFILAGFSMGGAIAIRYMGIYQGYGVNKLCLIGAAAPKYTRDIGFPYGVSVESVNELIKQASTDRPAMCREFSRRLVNLSQSSALIQWFEKISLSASGIGTISAAYALRDEDCRMDMNKIKVPTGIFHGVKDTIVPYELALLLHKEINGSRLFSFNNSGHAVFYDELQLFNTKLLDFLS